MDNRQTFITVHKNFVCINLSPRYFVYLLILARRKFCGNIARTIAYLLMTHRQKLFIHSRTPWKRKLTATYQPRQKDYKRYKISMEPALWGKLFQLRIYLGYSISYIIRLTLEWEMANERHNNSSQNRRRENASFVMDDSIWHDYSFEIKVLYSIRFVTMYLRIITPS